MNEQIRNTLTQLSLFRHFTADDLDVFVSLARPMTVSEGTLIFSEGEAGDELYVVIEGRVISSSSAAGTGERPLGSYVKGDFFGEMAVFENKPRSAGCVSEADSVLLAVSRESFKSFIDQHPKAAGILMLNMLNTITERLEEKSSFLAEMINWGERAGRRAYRDDLTGIYNRRHFDEALPDSIRTASASGKKLALIMMDIDNFREISEACPPEVVDGIIRLFVEKYSAVLREKDIFIRYGGDEFCVIMPDTGGSDAERVAETGTRTIEDIDLAPITGMSGLSITLSQGIAMFPDSADNPAALMKQADTALYHAKNSGKNRVYRV